MKNAGTILMYNCSGEEFSKLRQIFAMLRLRMRVVSPERYHILPQALLNQVLEVIRVANLPPIPRKAVLTETNKTWDTKQLHAELLKEREAIAAEKDQKA